MRAKHGLVMDAWIHVHSLRECEKEVVEVLESHLEKHTSSVPQYPTDRSTVPPQRSVIRVVRDPTFSWKLGLKKAFIQRLRYLQSEEAHLK